MYNNNNRDRNFGGNYQRQMHDATCSECGKKTQVPFRPKEGLPVFCKECYFKHKNEGKTYNKRDSNEEEEY